MVCSCPCDGTSLVSMSRTDTSPHDHDSTTLLLHLELDLELDVDLDLDPSFTVGDMCGAHCDADDVSDRYSSLPSRDGVCTLHSGRGCA